MMTIQTRKMMMTTMKNEEMDQTNDVTEENRGSEQETETPEFMMSPSLLIELAKDVEKGNPIDWQGMDQERDIIYSFMADRLCKFFQSESFLNLTDLERICTLQAATLNLSVQNFINEKVKLETADDLK